MGRGPKTWFVSDLHLGHESVAVKHRGFESVEEHDDSIIGTILDHVAPGDTLWNLGDISSGSTTGQQHALKLLGDIKTHRKGMVENPPKFNLILGNHDGLHPMHRGYTKNEAAYREVFDHISPVGMIRLAGHRIMMSHFPYKKDRGEPRYVEWRLKDTGRYLLHGHTHSTERYDGREIHVGWDSWHRPVSADEIAAHIQKQEAKAT